MRRRRAFRWLLRSAAKTLVLVTVWSLTFNALTPAPRHFVAPSGHDVRVSLRDGRHVGVHYERWGDASSTAPPLLLVHGFAESSVTWSLVAPTLAEKRPVIAIDLAGYGYSEYSGRYTLADERDLVVGVIDALHLRAPTLVGHSLGAAVVGAVALENPGRISGVVFVDGDALPFEGRTGDRGPVLPFALRTPYATSAYRLVTRWSLVPRRIFDAQCGSVCLGLRGPAGDHLVDAWMRPLRQRAAEEAMVDMAAQAMLHLTPQQVRAIRVPRGLVWGAEDESSGGSFDGARGNLGDPPTAVVAHAGHLPMVADPSAFTAGLEGVLAHMARQAG